MQIEKKNISKRKLGRLQFAQFHFLLFQHKQSNYTSRDIKQKCVKKLRQNV